MNKTKIEWCDATWNPVTGCLHDCKYCYARKIARRFKGNLSSDFKAVIAEINKKPESPYPYGFTPTFHRYRINITQKSKNSQNIFVCSMADLFGDWVPDEWIQEVFESCEAAPQHRYLFLTKNPKRYIELAQNGNLPDKENYWFGSTVTNSEDTFAWFENTPHHGFVSIEPLHAPLGELESVHMPEWVIVGAETGNRKDKVIPKKEWINNIIHQCKKINIPVFLKDSLIPIIGEENMIREFPW